MSKVVIIKLVNGSELIATQEGSDFEVKRYSKVREFHVSQQGAGLIPFIMCNPDATIEIKDGIVAIVDAPAELEKQYLAATSSLQLLS